MMKDESHIGTIETRKVLVAVVEGEAKKKKRMDLDLARYHVEWNEN